MFDQITAPLVGRDAVARRRQDEIVFVVLIGPQCAALGTEGAGAAGYRFGPLRDGELGGSAVATSLDCHPSGHECRLIGFLEPFGRHATTVTEKLSGWRRDSFDQRISHISLRYRLFQYVTWLLRNISSPPRARSAETPTLVAIPPDRLPRLLCRNPPIQIVGHRMFKGILGLSGCEKPRRTGHIVTYGSDGHLRSLWACRP